jgi:hypothetical protein
MHTWGARHRQSRRAPTAARPTISLLQSRFIGAKKTSLAFTNFSFTRLRSFFSVVALKIFIGSGIKLSSSVITLCIKGETVSAIKMKVVPSFSIFQEISGFAMGGLELCPNA